MTSSATPGDPGSHPRCTSSGAFPGTELGTRRVALRLPQGGRDGDGGWRAVGRGRALGRSWSDPSIAAMSASTPFPAGNGTRFHLRLLRGQLVPLGRGARRRLRPVSPGAHHVLAGRSSAKPKNGALRRTRERLSRGSRSCRNSGRPHQLRGPAPPAVRPMAATLRRSDATRHDQGVTLGRVSCMRLLDRTLPAASKQGCGFLTRAEPPFARRIEPRCPGDNHQLRKLFVCERLSGLGEVRLCPKAEPVAALQG
jgi:hypothetical protein